MMRIRWWEIFGVLLGLAWFCFAIGLLWRRP